MFRPPHVVVGALALMATACNDSNSNFVPAATATIRLVNDTDTPLSLIVRGIPDSANTRITFGQASNCVIVDLASTTVPAVTVTNAVTGASINFTPALTVGASLTVVAFGDTLGVQFATLSNRFVPATNDAGLRFFNGAPSAGSLFMQRAGIALTPFIGFGAASNFVSVPTDSASITFSNGSSVVLDAGLMAFPLGQNSTVLVGPPASGTIPLRFFTVQGC